MELPKILLENEENYCKTFVWIASNLAKILNGYLRNVKSRDRYRYTSLLQLLSWALPTSILFLCCTWVCKFTSQFENNDLRVPFLFVRN